MKNIPVMKKIVKVAMLAVALTCGVGAYAQTEMGDPTSHVVIDYRRPGMISFDLGMTLSPMDRTDGGLQPTSYTGFNGGLAFDIPISKALDLSFRVPYYTLNGYKLNESRYVRLEDGSSMTIQSEECTVHTLNLVALGLNLYPFRKCFYMGGYFSIGFHFLSRTGYDQPNQQGNKYDVDINGFNINIDMGLETGFDIADKFILYGRWGLGLFALTDESERGKYNVPPIYPWYFQFGVRIPFFNERL